MRAQGARWTDARRRDAAVLAVGALLLVGWDLSGLDLVFARAFGGPAGFAWRDAWLTSTLAHQGGRALGWALLALLAVDAVRATPLLRGPSRAERRYWLATTFVSLLLIPALKRFSSTSCPWDLAEFGGLALHVSHWRLGIADGGAGHCFPSGHAVAAFAFFGAYFLLRGSRPALARAWLASVCLLGLAFGAAQLARGAHYPSHTLWSAWLCWAVCTLAAHWAPTGPLHRTGSTRIGSSRRRLAATAATPSGDSRAAG